MSRVRLINILSKCSGGSNHGKINIFPPDVYPIVGIVSFACVMGLGSAYYTATKPNNGIQYKVKRLRKSVSKTFNDLDNKLKR